MKIKNTAVSLLSLFVLGAGAFEAKAITTFVSSSGALGANDSVDWGLAGPAFTVLSSPFTILSANGLTMTVSTSNGSVMERRDQSSGGWGGNFAPDDRLLWNRGGGGDLIIDFPTAIYGLGGGAQAQSDYYGAFTGTISAYDSTLTLLGSFGFTGTSTSAGDNSAVFAGLASTTADIRRLVFHAENPSVGGVDFAINGLQLKTTPANVPDAGSTLPLLGFALVGMGMLRRYAKS